LGGTSAVGETDAVTSTGSEDVRPANRLAGETSPYLLQHAHNPVDWYPWGPEALERAAREDKPILLSIGYAACHWCHVMERESFVDPPTAELMNDHFVSIKVDREERPDLDAIYMDAVQAMTGSGGWPMTVFLSPDGTPFYAGTYFPKEDRYGMPAFRRVLLGVADAWKNQRGVTDEQGRRVLQVISRAAELAPSEDALDESVLGSALESLRESFDPEWGGFGGAPKFPQPMTLEFLLRCRARGADGAGQMLDVTLDRMARGGIYDHVGGGFHRYSTDARWHVPHFEKMLYDNAQLARLYAHARVDPASAVGGTVGETLQYLTNEMRHERGGFFSSQDADSEGVEGKFYVWSWEELLDTASRIGGYAPLPRPIDDDESSRQEWMDGLRRVPAELVARCLGAAVGGNWEGTNVLWQPERIEAVALEAGLAVEHVAYRVWYTLHLLLETRATRIAPATDDKVLAAWNGLAIAALADASLDDVFHRRIATDAAEFVLTHMRRDDGRLLRAWRDGKAGGPGYLDDYALMADGLLALYEATFETRWFREARSLADDMLRLFRDETNGGFFQTGSDAEQLVVRPKDLYDNAVPSGNSAAAMVLLRLARFTGDADYEEAAMSALRLVADGMRRAPSGFGHALCALDFAVGPVKEVAIVGDPNGEGTKALVAVVRERYRPNVVVAVAASDDTNAAEAIPLLRDRPQEDGKATAYICERFTCKLPVTEPGALRGQLAH
jgi:uncharacterized protein YyaL (SSP411 family)